MILRNHRSGSVDDGGKPGVSCSQHLECHSHDLDSHSEDYVLTSVRILLVERVGFFIFSAFLRRLKIALVALTQSLLSGSKEEWSLVRRHPSERLFGIQVAGNRPAVLVPASEVIAREIGNGGISFVDVNCGCPIDLVFKSGSGSACRFLFLHRSAVK